MKHQNLEAPTEVKLTHKVQPDEFTRQAMLELDPVKIQKKVQETLRMFQQFGSLRH